MPYHAVCIVRSDFTRLVAVIHRRMGEQQVVSPSRVIRQMEDERVSEKLNLPQFVKGVLKANAKRREKAVDVTSIGQPDNTAAAAKRPRKGPACKHAEA